MKKVLTTVAATLIAMPALAGTNVLNVTDKYRTVTERVPQTKQICSTVDVPIYGKTGNGASGADVLTGMIIGGLIGKGVTNKDNGAAAGAVIGGVMAADKAQGQDTVIGYRQEQRCHNETTYSISQQEVYSHSIITFEHEGRTYRLQFQK